MMAMANEVAEAVDFDLDDEDLMDEDVPADQVDARAIIPKIRSTVGSAGAKRTKGRGFREDTAADRNHRFAGRDFESLDFDGGGLGPVRSVEGWIVLVTGIYEEAQEEDILNAFNDIGQVKNLHLNLDRRTGYVKGYALIEYESYKEALAAIQTLNGAKILERTISVGWAFCDDSFIKKNLRRSSTEDHHRSRSPSRRTHLRRTRA